jgi:hypothetical protein
LGGRKRRQLDGFSSLDRAMTLAAENAASSVFFENHRLEADATLMC